jgi:class 3 adenylate cyclase
MSELPTGTVTFLFTDIEGSTALLKELREGYLAVLDEHHRILRKAVEEQHGREIDNQGDSFFFVFERANSAVGAAVLAQRALSEHAWPEGVELRVRMGLHTGEPIVGEERYVGLGVHRAARIGTVAHGGQVLLSNATRELVEDGFAGVSVRDLGSYRLKDLDRDERLYQLDVAGLRDDFPPLRAMRMADPRATSQTEVQIGSEFLGYRIEELIGQGGMGVVYRAYDLRLKRTVALKLVTPELAFDERFRERFTRETELAMSLEHPNVVPIHDAGDVVGRLYLAMRLVPGTDLRRLLQAEGALESSRTVAICRQIANALDAAHARALVHRDVKPSNVLLDEDEHVYLADFGLTRRLEEQGAGEGRSVGTPAYLAPEQIEGGSVDGRADGYSLGCVLFECLTGKAPYPRGSPLAVAWAHLAEEPPSATELNPELPKTIEPVLQKAIAKEPGDRYPSCGALIAAAESALGLAHASRFGGPRLLLAAAAIALLAVAAAIAVAFSAGGGGDRRSPVLFGHANTAVRIDPMTNKVSAVIPVDPEPLAVAAGGDRVWVYNSNATVSEIDPATNEVRHRTWISDWPTHLSWYDGPVLTADAGGAWIVGTRQGQPVLTRVFSHGKGKVEHGLPYQPRAVVVGADAVWVLCRGPRDVLLRIDPKTGKRTATTVLPTSFSVTGLGVGEGFVWVVASSPSALYRISARSAKLRGALRLAGQGAPPRVAFGSVWIALTTSGGMMHLVDPRSLEEADLFSAEPPDEGREVAGFGSEWVLDSPSGSVARFHHTPGGGTVIATIRIARPPEKFYGPPLTSIAAGVGAIWATVGPSQFD